MRVELAGGADRAVPGQRPERRRGRVQLLAQAGEFVAQGVPPVGPARTGQVIVQLLTWWPCAIPTKSLSAAWSVLLRAMNTCRLGLGQVGEVQGDQFAAAQCRGAPDGQ